MKKILALVLAILMLASFAVASAFAEEEYIDFEVLFPQNGIDSNVYVGKPVEASPMLDGVINDGEYSATRVLKKDGPYTQCVESDLTEYFAHDEDFVYYAYSVKQTHDNKAGSFQFKVQNDYKYLTTLKGYYPRVCTYFRLQADGSIDFSQNDNNSGQENIVAPEWGTDMWVAGTWDFENTKVKTCEIKISKAYFCDQLEIEKDELRLIQYYIYLHNNIADEMGGDHIWGGVNVTRDVQLLVADAGASKSLEDVAFFAMILEEEPEAPVTTTTVATTTEAPAATTTSLPVLTEIAPATTTAAATTTTTAKAADATTTAAAEDGGCGSTLAISALVMIPTLAGGVILTSKKRSDD